MKLYIAEKASVGRALADALSGERRKCGIFLHVGPDIVAWAAGHLLELYEPDDYDEKYARWGRETLFYRPAVWKRKGKSATKGLLDALKKLIKGLDRRSDVVVNVGDADREGQLLIDEILDHCGWKGATERLRINDMNPDAIRKALAETKDNAAFRGEYMAGQARLYADWLVGLSLTRFVTVSLREAGYDTPAKSVGRVQAPTLGLVVARDREVREFSPKPYFELSALLSLEDGRKLRGRWAAQEKDASFSDAQNRLRDADYARRLLANIEGGSGTIVAVSKKAHQASPPLPYSLSKLQIAASKKHDITDALVHLQKLYESGYVTYPRTDCEYLPEGHHQEAPRVLETIRVACPEMGDMIHGALPEKKSPAWNTSKLAEHHAIIPTARYTAPLERDRVRKKIRCTIVTWANANNTHLK